MNFIHIKPIKIDEAPPEAELGLLSTFIAVSKRHWWEWLFRQSKKNLCLEVASIEQQTHFQLAVPSHTEGYFVSQLLSHHPQLYVSTDEVDNLKPVTTMPAVVSGNLSVIMGSTLPLKTSTKQEDTPLFGGVLGYLAKVPVGEAAGIQLFIRTTNEGYWLNRIRSQMVYSSGIEGKEVTSPYKKYPS